MSNLHLQRWGRGLEALAAGTSTVPGYRRSGRITRATGIVLEAVGLRLPLGAGCRIELVAAGPAGPAVYAEAEVIGFAGELLYLMPLEEIHGLQAGARFFALADEPGASDGVRPVPLGMGLLGRVLDSSGNPFDGKGAVLATHRSSLHGQPINPLQRAPIEQQIDVGIRAINAMLSVGKGQRLGLFAGSGVGKSVLLGMMARYTQADVVVVGLIGERGREVQDFIDNILGEEGLRRSVVVAAPADASPLQRLQGALYATRLAEDFRDQGKDVLLIMDSLTRYAMAQREIALALGEPPATKGYPPSVFAKLPKLVERAGNGPRGGGSITAFYTVLSEGDDQQDPIADSARAILDGHFVLSRKLAESGHYPAIDIEASISRAMSAIVSESQQRKAQKLKQALSRYQRNRDLISVGAYAPGHDAQLDRAVTLYPHIERFLQQQTHERSSVPDTLAGLNLLFPGK